jgi:hypothetical protein
MIARRLRNVGRSATRDFVGFVHLAFSFILKARGKSGESPAAKRKPRRSGASRATWKPSPRNGARGRVDLRLPRERGLYKIDHFNEKPAGDAPAPA